MTQHPYVASLLDACARSAGGTPATQGITLAGQAVQLVFHSPRLAGQLLPALAHLPPYAGNAPPSLTIHVWESPVEDLPLPDNACERVSALMAEGERWGSNLRREDNATYSAQYMPPPNESLCVYDPATGTALYWTPNARAIPYYERGAPLRPLFDRWLADHGLLLTHAAAVGNDRGGALIVGKGGRGKSTSAIVSLLWGKLQYVADDYLVLQAPPEPRALSIYNTGKLDADHLLARLPGLVEKVENAQRLHEEKALFFFHQHCPERIALSLPLRVALLPQVSAGAQSRLEPAAPGRLLVGLAASTLYQSQYAGQRALASLAATLRALPCYHLHIGSDLDGIPPVIEEAIGRHSHE